MVCLLDNTKSFFSLTVFLDPAPGNSSHSFCHINMIIAVNDVQLSIEILEVVFLLDKTKGYLCDDHNCSIAEYRTFWRGGGVPS